MERSTRHGARYGTPPRRRPPILLNLVWLLLPVAMLAALSPFVWNAGVAWYQAYTSGQLAPPAQTFNTTPALAAPAAAPAPIAPAPVSQDTAPAVAPPVAPETATDIAAAQQSQPDDYTELTKPNTRVLPTLEPESHMQQQVAPVSQSAANEGSKPARHRP